MHLRRVLALSLAVPLMFAGCTEEGPKPKLPDPTTSSPTPTPTETETVEEESAEEFIRRWADALLDMQVTGKTEAFRNLGPDCESCNETASRVEAIYAAGGSIEWDGWTIVSIRQIGSSASEFRVVEKSAPTRFRESADAPWQRLKGGRTPHVFELFRDGESWLVVRTAEMAR